ncbi:MAG: flagellar basal-body MS-ring/collar protein FliF [Anaerovoracaceae bacterium]
MRERLDKILEQLKVIREKIGRRNLIIILAVTLAVIIGIVVLIRVAGAVSYEVLYTGLSQEEQVEILGKLQELGIQSQSTNDGEIRVVEGQSDSARAQLALEGYPKSGLSYDVFTANVSMTSTDFEKETYKLYELQDRLAATIRCFSGVRDATVTIAVGEKSTYVLSSGSQSDSPTTASVTVIMMDGGSPAAEQVAGIKKLVSSSVPGMTPEDVTVIDGNGNEVSAEGEQNSLTQATSLSSLKVELEEKAERSIKAKVQDLLEPVYGEDRVRVAVNCTVDIDKKVSELLTYYPSEEGNNSGVTSKMTLNWEAIGNVESPGGVVGTETNSEVPTYPYLTEGDDGTYYADQRTYDYLVSQLTEQIEKDAGEITDTNVAVVIDSGKLTNDDIMQLTELVGVTAGIDAEARDAKVSVMDTRFFTPEEPAITQTLLDQLKAMGPLLYILIGVLALFLLILMTAAIMMNRKKKKRIAQTVMLQPEEEEEELDWDIETINLEEMEATREQVLKNQIREFASQNPDIAASLIKNWLREEGE